MTKDTWIFAGLAIGAFCASLACYEYNTIKVRQLNEKKVENQRLYFEKLTPEQVENLEREKLDIEKKKIELKMTEDELKKTVSDFKNQIQQEVEKAAMDKIHDNMRDTFDTWSAKFETRLENKIDNVVTRIDNLSDKYGGVKEAGNSAPSINVVNAPNN